MRLAGWRNRRTTAPADQLRCQRRYPHQVVRHRSRGRAAPNRRAVADPVAL